MTESQAWLEDNYPLMIRKNITKLDISNRKLENSLKLEGFTELKEFSCGRNEITYLEIIDCPQLEEVDCAINKLVELNIKDCSQLKKLCAYSNLLNNLDLSQNNQLEELNIDNNNFSQQNLSFLSHLTNLKKVWLGNNIEWKISQGIYNRFTGSLEFLSAMSKLEWCDISNTDINSGLEYLPESLESFRHFANYRQNSENQVFTKLLEDEKETVFSQKIQEYKQKFQPQILVLV